jgi:polyribonucleotide nucleotidyltransferase
MIDPEKIGALIGPGGKNIRRITEYWNVKIDIEDDGSVFVFSSTPEGLKGAKAEIQGMTAEAEIGRVYKGPVTGIKEFGAFVEILPGKEGLLHISEIANERVGRANRRTAPFTFSVQKVNKGSNARY